MIRLMHKSPLGIQSMSSFNHFTRSTSRKEVDCFIALGGNIGDTFKVFEKAIEAFSETQGISNVRSSPVYRTSPVSDLPQEDYLNAVCRLSSTLSPFSLFEKLEGVEKKIGKALKAKNAPRLIDIDLLFYGTASFHSYRLTLPHPLWYKRLFVLAPLSNLISIAPKKFPTFDFSSQWVIPLSSQLPFHTIEFPNPPFIPVRQEMDM